MNSNTNKANSNNNFEFFKKNKTKKNNMNEMFGKLEMKLSQRVNYLFFPLFFGIGRKKKLKPSIMNC